MLQIGRQGQLYAALESTFGTSPSLAATNALRHKNFLPTYDPKNRVNTAEKKTSPARMTAGRFDRRVISGYSLEALLRPSGTINTLPECSPVLEAAFGTKTNVALSTTISAGTGAVGGATLVSGTGMAANGAVLITCPDGKKRVRRLTAANSGTGVVTWAPNLPAGQVPADGAAVKSCTMFKLTTLLALSLALGHYHKFTDGTAGLKRLLTGAGVDKLTMNFDANAEPSFTASGPAQEMEDAAAQPGGFTTVGSQPPSGLTGELVVGSVYDMKFLKLAIDISNGLFMRNESYGYTKGEELLRGGYRDITIGIDARAEVEATLYDLAEAGTNVALFNQTGFTEGNIVAFAAPQVEFKVPNTDDPDEAVNWPFKGMALESADNTNDELFLMLA